MPGWLDFGGDLLKEADLVFVVVFGSVIAVEDHVAAHEDEIGSFLESVESGDALSVPVGGVAAMSDVLVGKVNEGERTGGSRQLWCLG